MTDHGGRARRGHVRLADRAPSASDRGRPSVAPVGRRARLRQLLDGRDHRPRGVRHARRRRRRRPVARPRHRRARPAAAHPDGRRHGRAPPCRRCTPTPTSSSASASRRPSSLDSGTASPYGDRPLARVREYVDPASRSAWPASRSPSRATSTRSAGSGSASASASATRSRPRRAQPADAARWPARSPTACCSTTCPASHVPWSVEQVPATAAATPRSTPTSTSGCASATTASSLARRDLFCYAVVDAYARNFERGRLRRRGRRDPRAPRRRRPRRARWPR